PEVDVPAEYIGNSGERQHDRNTQEKPYRIQNRKETEINQGEIATLTPNEKKTAAPRPTTKRTNPTTIIIVCDRRSAKENDGVASAESRVHSSMSTVIPGEP